MYMQSSEHTAREGYAIFAGKNVHAFVISQWCKEKGMTFGTDYTWYMHGNKQIVFKFKDPLQATMAVLQWT